MPQYARPAVTLTGNSFLNQSSSNANMWNVLDEVVSDNADYVISELNPVNNVIALKLSSVTDPIVNTGHIINFTYKKDVTVSPEQIDLVVQLRQDYQTEAANGTLIASNTLANIPSAWTTGAVTLTAGEAAAISDYANLTLTFSFNKP